MKKLILIVALIAIPAVSHAEEKMSKKQAYDIIGQVLSQFRGTIQEHQALQQAYQTLKPESAESNEVEK